MTSSGWRATCWERSSPEEKCPPAPLTTMARVSSGTASKKPSSAATRSSLSALRLSGRLRVRWLIAPFCPTSSTLSLVITSFLFILGVLAPGQADAHILGQWRRANAIRRADHPDPLFMGLDRQFAILEKAVFHAEAGAPEFGNFAFDFNYITETRRLDEARAGIDHGNAGNAIVSEPVALVHGKGGREQADRGIVEVPEIIGIID